VSSRYAVIPRELAEHELKIFPNANPIKQSMCHYSPEKSRLMGKEINRLLEGKFIREIKEVSLQSCLRRKTPKSIECASTSQQLISTARRTTSHSLESTRYRFHC
jgi:hypothetical protein